MENNQSMSETARGEFEKKFFGESPWFRETASWHEESQSYGGTQTQWAWIGYRLALSTLPTMTEAWISTSEKLPEKSMSVIICMNDEVCAAYYEYRGNRKNSVWKSAHVGWWQAASDSKAITHWMPLPKNAHLLTPEPLVKVGGES